MYFFVPCLLRDSENEEYIITFSRGIYSKLLVHHNIVSHPSVLERNLFKEQIVLVSWKTEI